MEISAEDLIAGLADLRQDGILCDITLQTEGKHISAHRALLAAASPYFRAMFGGNFKEAKDNVINLDNLGVSSVGLTVIVDCVYSLKFNITEENFFAVTEAANLLQFGSMISLCEQFLESHLDIHNCIQILQISETHGMKVTGHAVDTFLLENLIAVSEHNPDFAEISKDRLLCYIADTELFTHDETEVYKAVMKWIKYMPSRDKHTVELMRHVRMHHIPLDVINEDLAKEHLLLLNEECVKQVKEAIEYHYFPYGQPLFKALPPRGERAMIEVEKPEDTGERKWYLKPYPSYGKSFSPIAQHCVSTKASEFSCVTLGNFCYFVCLDIDKLCHMRYDPVANKWLRLASHPYEHVNPEGFLYETLQDSLIYGGGLVENCKPQYCLRRCFIYSINDNTWEQIIDLPEAMYNPLSDVHNNCLYITAYFF